MYKKFFTVFLGALALNAYAVDDTASSPKVLKIGVVDVRAVVQESPQLQALNLQLTQKYKPREQAIIAAQVKFKAEEDKYNKTAGALSDSERTKLQNSLIFDRANLQAMITSFQQDLDNEQNSDMQKLLSQVASIVNDIAKKEHYDLILQADSVPYANADLNITKAVLRNLNAHD